MKKENINKEKRKGNKREKWRIGAYFGARIPHTEGVTIDVEPTLEQEFRKGQIGDAKIQEIKDLITEGQGLEFMKDEQGTV
jgi:hypothetical protein